jgi:hypothetical protein
LTLHVPSLGDSDGMVQEWDELCCDHQILDIRPPTPVGDYEAVLEE